MNNDLKMMNIRSEYTNDHDQDFFGATARLIYYYFTGCKTDTRSNVASLVNSNIYDAFVGLISIV